MIHRIRHLAGERIDPTRLTTWRFPSATLAVPNSALVSFAEFQKPKIGDLVLAEVVKLGQCGFIENREGCNMQIFEGTVILGTYSTRYAPDEYEAHIPEIGGEGQVEALLNRGGTIGTVVSKNSSMGDPTMVRLRSMIADESGKIVNTKDYGLLSSSTPKEENSDRKLILVVGASMDAGKSNAAKAVIYSLSATGHRVVAGKVTGTAARRDALLMKAAGAVETIDFCNLGYPATYLLPEEEVKGVFWRIYNHLYEKAGPGGYIVLEIADGILQRECEMLLSDPQIKNRIDKLVFACSGPLDAKGGIEVLADKFDMAPSAIAGRVANSPMGRQELMEVLGAEVPIFNTLTIDVPKVAEMMTSENLQASLVVNI